MANLLAYARTLHGSPENSDCTLIMCHDDRELGSLPAHSIVLAAGSEMLAASLGRWTRRSAPEVRVQLPAADDLDPAMHAVAVMYTGELPGGLTTPRVLDVLRVADFLGSPACVEACSARLRESEPADFGEACAVLEASAAPHLAGVPDFAGRAFAHVVAHHADADRAGAVAAALRARLGDLLDVAGTPYFMQSFCALPAPALELLFRLCPRVDHENTVALLLHAWGWTQGPSEAVAATARRLLRPLDLCPTYLFHVVPSSAVFALSDDEKEDLWLAAYVDAATESAANALCAVNGVFGARPEWLTREDRFEWSPRGVRLDVAVTPRKAVEAAGTRVAASEPAYAAGFDWSLYVAAEREGDDGALTLAPFVHASLPRGMPKPQRASLAVTRRTTIGLGGRVLDFGREFVVKNGWGGGPKVRLEGETREDVVASARPHLDAGGELRWTANVEF